MRLDNEPFHSVLRMQASLGSRVIEHKVLLAFTKHLRVPRAHPHPRRIRRRNRRCFLLDNLCAYMSVIKRNEFLVYYSICN